MLAALDAGYGVVIGSREGEGASREGEPAFRHIMGRVFNRLVRLIAVPGINDTQCGFKLFRADAVAAIVPRLRLYGADAPVSARRAGDGVRCRSAGDRAAAGVPYPRGAGALAVRHAEQSPPGRRYILELARCAARAAQ